MRKMLSATATAAATAAAVFASTFAYAQPTEDLAAMHDQMFGVSAQLNGNCSATLIWSDRDDVSGDVATYFLTAKHCVAGGEDRDHAIDIAVYDNNRIVKRDSYVATVKASHWDHDLALMELKDKDTFFPVTAKIAPPDRELVFGEPVWVVGYPKGMRLSVTDGRFGGIETHDWPDDGTEYFRATPDIVGGNSGGAMFHREGDDYELIAVTTGVFIGMWHIGLYTPLAAVHDFLEIAAPEIVGAERGAPRVGGM